ncbi:EnvZ/OmpR regulon moderator MzrA [Enterobacter sp. CC120223-11]|uniref:EnvZ/OmpR regulon moderator MzrA n=1 Tax=Enterobacter sp. CC120223-11 TaxID=1378073 RepID=UPI000BCBD0A9|nr:EnvZ/OmpR regulon moderator MzrA [Enterobacter sp. CC120223-11]SNY65936.1 SecD export protein N-terminal TM region [Enterobacter sp. CC120223-11]
MGLRNIIFHRFSLSLGALLLLCAVLWSWSALQQRESSLAIRPVSANISMPDGFSLWHHLDANGIRFKSITPQDDALVIKFESSDQSAAAKAVLDRTLPHGYIIAQQEDDDSLAPLWLSRLRDAPHRFG